MKPPHRWRRAGVFAVCTALGLAIAWAAWPATPWVPTPMRQLEMRCFTESAPVHYSFCINRVATSDNPDLVFHFHGRNGDSTWWNDETYYSGAVERRWQELARAAPTVVSVSFGPLWLLTDDVFLETVVPRIERELPQPIGRRMLVGESMGGVNALAIGLRSNAFAKVAALCAPLPTVSPYSTAMETLAYLQRSSTSLRRAATMVLLGRRFYSSAKVWEENNPLPLSGSFDPSGGPAFYISCGRADEWGCLEGSEALVSNLRERGARVEWRPMPGGHCDIDVDSLAAFLTEE